jgi:hypothetical protein
MAPPAPTGFLAAVEDVSLIQRQARLLTWLSNINDGGSSVGFYSEAGSGEMMKLYHDKSACKMSL